jgi:hypothetical protein
MSMTNLTETKASPLKLVKVTAAGTAVAVIVGLQLTMLGAILDMFTSVLLVGVGIVIGRSTK